MAFSRYSKASIVAIKTRTSLDIRRPEEAHAERGGRILLWPVAQAVSSDKDPQFPAVANTAGAKAADALESKPSVAKQSADGNVAVDCGFEKKTPQGYRRVGRTEALPRHLLLRLRGLVKYRLFRNPLQQIQSPKLLLTLHNGQFKNKTERHGFKNLWEGSEPASDATGGHPAFAGQSENTPGQTTPNAHGQNHPSLANP